MFMLSIVAKWIQIQEATSENELLTGWNRNSFSEVAIVCELALAAILISRVCSLWKAALVCSFGCTGIAYKLITQGLGAKGCPCFGQSELFTFNGISESLDYSLFVNTLLLLGGTLIMWNEYRNGADTKGII